MLEMEHCDPYRVERFLAEYTEPTGHFRTAARIEALDHRIAAHPKLTVADKVEAVKALAPRRDQTDPREELRLERILCSLSSAELPSFKFDLDYDGDYKDLEEYVFHDIDDEESQARIVEHLAKSQGDDKIGIKILTDVDDTIYANLVDERYPKKTFYPGALELYDAIKQEPFELEWIPVTTLSARPNPIAGTLEEGSLEALKQHTNGRLRPSALSGKVASSALGTIETLTRAERDTARKDPATLQERLLWVAARRAPDLERLERKIGEVKFNNFRRYAKVYPEYRFVFFGDSGQADSLTAQLMVTDENLRSEVVATFIHDLGAGASSPTFGELDRELVVSGSSADGRRIVLFRNHIQAAALAYEHYGLITPEALARVTRVALQEFLGIAFEDGDARKALQAEYKEDAEAAVKLVEKASGRAHGDEVDAILGQLKRSY